MRRWFEVKEVRSETENGLVSNYQISAMDHGPRPGALNDCTAKFVRVLYHNLVA